MPHPAKAGARHRAIRYTPHSLRSLAGCRCYPLRELPGCESDLQLLDDHLLLSLLICMFCPDQIDPRME